MPARLAGRGEKSNKKLEKEKTAKVTASVAKLDRHPISPPLIIATRAGVGHLSFKIRTDGYLTWVVTRQHVVALF